MDMDTGMFIEEEDSSQALGVMPGSAAYAPGPGTSCSGSSSFWWLSGTRERKAADGRARASPSSRAYAPGPGTSLLSEKMARTTRELPNDVV